MVIKSTTNKEKVAMCMTMRAVLALMIFITGCTDKEDTKNIPKTVEPFDVITMESSYVTQYAATLHGLALYNSIIVREQIGPEIGFCYSKLPNPDINDSIAIRPMVMGFHNIYADSSIVQSRIVRLAYNTTYYYRIFARTKDWIRYGEVMTFTTEKSSFKPIVDSVYNIGSGSAWVAWRLLTFENCNIDTKGVCVFTKKDSCTYYNYLSYYLGDTITKSFITDLIPNTEYVVCAFGKKAGGIYTSGNEITFRTTTTK